MSSSSPPASKQALRIGIETEFYLRHKKPNKNDSDLKKLASSVVTAHNKAIPTGLPEMRENVAMKKPENETYYTFWQLVCDITVETKKLPWGLEMISPILDHRPHSNWREIVTETWSILNKEFVVLADNHCSTQIHISLPEDKFSVDQLRLIAQAIIHFEPALEAIIPEGRRGNKHTKSNFHEICAGDKDLQRIDVVQAFDDFGSVGEVINAMNDRSDPDRFRAWNFLSLHKFKTIEFRLGAGSTTADDVFIWVELATKFVRAALAAVSCEDITVLDANVGGLREFLSRGIMEGEGPGCLEETLFKGKRPQQSLEPQVRTSTPPGERGVFRRAKN